VMRPFRVRESARARHVRLRLSLDEGLVVVVPRGFDTRRLPQMVAAKEAWIERAWARLTARDVRQGQSAARKAPSRELPRSILLSAVNETWTVSYGRTSATTVTVRQGARRRLTVSGKTSSAPLVRAGLKRWLLRRAHEVLEPWLAQDHQPEPQAAVPQARAGGVRALARAVPYAAAQSLGGVLGASVAARTALCSPQASGEGCGQDGTALG